MNTRPRDGAAPAASRPGFVDYLLILSGTALSLVLVECSALRADSASGGAAMSRLHPYLLFLPVGVILLWPLFYATQQLSGRNQALTAGEWVWGLAWLGMLVLAAWMVWRGLGSAADADKLKKGVLVGYAIFVVSMAVIAVVILFIDLVGRWPQPWTHPFCLTLMIWPVFPLAASWIWNIKVE